MVKKHLLKTIASVYVSLTVVGTTKNAMKCMCRFAQQKYHKKRMSSIFSSFHKCFMYGDQKSTEYC